jgi:hypothetical protein
MKNKKNAFTEDDDPLIEPVSFEMNAQLLRAFGPASLSGLSNANQAGYHVKTQNALP